MDGVKVVLGNRGMTVEAARECRKELESPGAFVTESRRYLLSHVFFRTTLP